jgi:LysM repeat protein
MEGWLTKMAGKHRAPSKSHVGPILLKTGAVVAMASAPALFSTATAQAAESDSVLAAIAHCESGGKNVRNSTGSSTASGYFQIVNGTWRAHGGLKFASTAIGASYSEQLQIARNILNGGQGLGAWSESKSCWSKKIGKVSAPVSKPTPKPVAKLVIKPPTPVAKTVAKPAVVKTPVVQKKVTSAPKVVKKQTAPPTRTIAKVAAQSYLIKRGDTLSHIARSNHSTVRRLAGLNRDTVKNVDLIYAGNHLRLG